MRSLYLYTLVVVLCAFSSIQLYGQAPLIQKVDPLITYPGDTIIISGNGFSDTPSDLQVWFGGVQGTIVESSNFGIEVIVPPQASVSNIEVLKLSTGRSATSLQQFMPVYYGTSNFTLNNFSAEVLNDTKFTSSHELYDLCSCDLNSDGKPDIAVTKFRRESQVFPNPTDMLFLRNESTGPGDVNFAAQLLPIPPGIATDNVICGDVDGDGKRDIVVTRATPARNSVLILRNTTATVGGSLTFAAPVTLFLQTGDVATRLALVDLTLDGRAELVVTNSSTSRQFYVFTNASSPGIIDFDNTPPLILATSPVLNNEAEIQDFNGDGLPDILVNVFQGGDLYFFKNISDESLAFASVQKITLPGNNSRIVSYDFGGSSLPDIAVTNTLDNETAILINESTESTISFAAPVHLATALEPWGLDVADIDGDGDADFTVANIIAGTANLNVFLNTGTTGTEFSRSDMNPGVATRNVIVTDFDGDAKPDIAYTGFTDTPGNVGSHVGIRANKNCHQPEILNESTFSICPGQTIRLYAIPAPGVTFQWKRNGVELITSNDPFYDITDAGTYTVTTKNADNSCEVSSANVVVTLGTGAAPSYPAISPEEPLCSSELLSLETTTTADEYFWTGPNGFTSNQQNPASFAVDIDDAGEYTLQVKVGACKSNVTKMRLDVLDLEDFKITSNQPAKLCEDKVAELTINVDVSEYTIDWSTGAQNDNSITVATSGTYTADITNVELGCVTPLEGVTLTFLQKPVGSFTVNDGCAGEDLLFDNESTTDPNATPVYAWLFGDGQTSSLAEPTHSYAPSKDSLYTAKLNIYYSEDNDCRSDEVSKEVAITYVIQPEIVAIDSVSCQVQLSVNGNFSAINWSTGETGSSILVTSGEISVNTTDAEGCPASDAITINELTPPAVTITADLSTIQKGDTITLESQPDDLFYTWSPSDGLSSDTVQNPIAQPDETITYKLLVTDSAGCTAEGEITITVESNATFPAGFSPNGDGHNDIWNINAETNPDCTLNIFDGRGRRIFEGKGINWDGTYQGKSVPVGTYYYVYGCPTEKPQTGSLLVFK